MKRISGSIKLFLLFIISTALILVGCGGNQQPAGNFTITITKPSDHAVIFWNQYPGLPRPIDIITSQPADDWMLYVNGSMSQDFSDSNMPAGPFGIPWNVPGPGLYTLHVVGRNTSNHATGSSNTVTVCVIAYAEDATSADVGVPYNYTGTCPPTIPNSISNDSVFLHTTVRPYSLAENFQCSSTPPSPILTFTANVTDPGHRTLFVTVAYHGVLHGSPGNFDPQILMLNQIGPNSYYGSTDSTPLGEANLENMFIGARHSSDSMQAIEWTAKAWGAHGELLAADGPHDVSVNPCQVLPEPTETPVPTIPVHSNPNQHGSGCSQYGDQNSCNLAGCSWNGSSCTVNP